MGKQVWHQSEIEVIDQEGKKISFTIFHNLKPHGTVDSLDAALDNWINRTEEVTAESLCQYINGKREKGMSNHYAFTRKQFEIFKQQNK
jgi:hypothetical protein